MKYILFVLTCFLIYSCDPYYRLSYSLKNQTSDTVYVKFMNYPDSLRIIAPAASVVLATRSGIGKAKKVYRSGNFQDWFKENSLLVKKDQNKTLKKVTDCEWKYEKGNAILFVKK